MRDFAARAAATDESDLTDQQRITRDVLISDATTRADSMETRLSEMAADPIFGPQVSMPILMGMLALPDADVAEALVDKLRGLGRYYGELAERQRDGVAAGRLPAAFAAADTDEPARRPALEADRRRPAADHDHAAATGLDVDAWKGRLREVVETRRTSRSAGLPRRAARRGPPARPTGRPVRPELGARRRRGVRRNAAPLHHHDEDRPGDPRHRPRADREARGRVPQPRPRGRRHRRPVADLQGHAQRAQAALQQRRRAGHRIRGGHAARVGRDARVVRGAAAGPVCGAADDHRSQGVLLPARRRRQPRWHVLRQRRRPDLVGDLRAASRWPSTRAFPATTSSSPSRAS